MRRFISVLAVGLLLGTPGFAKGWPSKDAKIGAENHPKLVSQNGGEVENKRLQNYIKRIGKKVVAESEFSKRKWTFTVLDTPVVNAFALPGGYVYMTRGLLALANDEAEVAGVIGHEIAHLTRNHVGKRAKRNQNASIGVLAGTIIGGLLDGKDGIKKGIELSTMAAKGYVGVYSQGQEFESDQVGQRYMIGAGYDPLAQAEFLHSMGRRAQLEAEIAGREYNPNQVSIFASHPATAERVKKATDLARGIVLREFLKTGEMSHMDAISGMVYGDSAGQGFVRGRKFLHPNMRFAFEVPKGFRITNSARRVVSRGPKGTSFVLTSGGKAGGSLKKHITDKWIPAIGKDAKVGRVSDLKSYTQNGLKQARAVVPIQNRNGTFSALLTVIEHNGLFYRFTSLAPEGDRNSISQMAAATGSFRPLAASEARKHSPYRIEAYRVRRGDTVKSLIKGRPYGSRAAERFLTMNGLAKASDLRAGDMVKLIAR